MLQRLCRWLAHTLEVFDRCVWGPAIVVEMDDIPAHQNKKETSDSSVLFEEDDE